METEEQNNQVVGGKLPKGGGGGGGGSKRAKGAEQEQQQQDEQDTLKCSSKSSGGGGSPRKRQQQSKELASVGTDSSNTASRAGLRSRSKVTTASATAITTATAAESNNEDSSSSEEQQPLLRRSLRNRTVVSNNSAKTGGAGSSAGAVKTATMKQKINCDNYSDTKKLVTGDKKEDSVISRNNSFKKNGADGGGDDAVKSNYCCAQNRRQVLSFAEAPSYLKFNPYITGGYRTALTPAECVRSLFWWTNETLNIWSHLLGWMFFLGLSIYDAMGLFALPNTHPWDRAIVVMLLIAFQACMLLSALYHVFCCCSERFYRRWLSADLFGVSLSLLAIYVSGIYYAFSCVPIWLNFYLITVGIIFVSAMVLQIIPVVKKPTTAEAFHWRLVVFGGWAAYGIVPTMHWALLHGGTSSPVVSLLLPRIFAMYGISMAAFFFYVLRVPEKLYPGLVNFIGSSHQIWHILIVVAFYHWHNTGILYLQFRANNLCQDEYAFLYSTTSSSPSVDQTVEAK